MGNVFRCCTDAATVVAKEESNENHAINNDMDNNSNNHNNTNNNSWDNGWFIYGGNHIDADDKLCISKVRVAPWVTEIHDEAFKLCELLEEIEIHDHVQRIGHSAFLECINLQIVRFVSISSVEEEKDHKQAHRSATESTPTTTTEILSRTSSKLMCIGNNAFQNCLSLKSIKFPGRVQQIGESAFQDCRQLVDIQIFSNGERNGKEKQQEQQHGQEKKRNKYSTEEGAKKNCFGMLRIIEKHTFRRCENLRSLTLPDTIEEIRGGAFLQCRIMDHISFRSVHGNAPNESDSSPFAGDKKKPSPTLGGSPQQLVLHQDGAATLSTTDGKQLESVEVQVTKFPDSIRMIGNHAFESCHSLKAVTFSTQSASLSMGCNVFEFCRSLEYIQLPKTLREIPDGTCLSCIKLRHIVFPSSIRRIGPRAFADCKELSNLEFPMSLREIGEAAFRSCTGLKGTIKLPDHIERIGGMAFSRCPGLEEVRFCSSSSISSTNNANNNMQCTLRALEQCAFTGCTGLVKINLPDSVEKIGGNAFRCCTSLPSLTLPRQLKEIQECAFFGCSSLERLDNLATNACWVEKIGWFAFGQCPKLRVKNEFVTCGGSSGRDDDSSGNDRSAAVSDTATSGITMDTVASMYFMCDMNCGGRRFLRRGDDDGRTTYPSSLWPIIFHRVLHTMVLSKERMFHTFVEIDPSSYLKTDPVTRRASIIYYLMVNGFAMDCPSR